MGPPGRSEAAADATSRAALRSTARKMRVSAAEPRAAQRGARLLPPFLRTLLALGVIVAPVLGGVLPEDQADLMYHSYQGGDITVRGPSVLIRKKVGDSLSLSYNYYEDMISSASIDVKLSASPYHEIRKQNSFGADYLHGKTTYSLGYIYSREPDYIASTSYYSISQDMFGDLTTISLGYRRGWDQVYRDLCAAPHPNNQECPDIINDPTFHQRADHRGYTFGLTQILTRNLLANVNYEIDTDQGYLANPYRQIRYASPGGVGFTLAPQVYPNTRTSNAASVLLKYYLPWRATLTGSYRFYHDTFGIVGSTAEADYTMPMWKGWIFDGSLRYYTQTHASFYSDLFPYANYSNFMARDRELAAFNSWTAGIGASYEFPIPRLPWIHKSTANIRYDRMMINYKDFRDALLAAQYGAGSEPLYKLDANVLEVFLSLWY